MNEVHEFHVSSKIGVGPGVCVFAAVFSLTLPALTLTINQKDGTRIEKDKPGPPSKDGVCHCDVDFCLLDL